MVGGPGTFGSLMANMSSIITLRISLSEYGVGSVSDIVTDVIDSRLLRLSRVADGSCLAELSLACIVDEDSVRARFKAKTRTLLVTATPASAIMTPSPHDSPAAAIVSAPTASSSSLETRDVEVTAANRSSSSPSTISSSSCSSCDVVRHTAESSVVESEQPSAPTQSPCTTSVTNAATLSAVAPPAGTSILSPVVDGIAPTPPMTVTAATMESSAEVASHCSVDFEADLAVGIDGSGLAELLGYSFGPSSKVPSIIPPQQLQQRQQQQQQKLASSTAVKKKLEKHKNEVCIRGAINQVQKTATSIIRQLGDSLHANGWAICGEVSRSFYGFHEVSQLYQSPYSNQQTILYLPMPLMCAGLSSSRWRTIIPQVGELIKIVWNEFSWALDPTTNGILSRDLSLFSQLLDMLL